jgi:hypothetical protein
LEVELASPNFVRALGFRYKPRNVEDIFVEFGGNDGGVGLGMGRMSRRLRGARRRR